MELLVIADTDILFPDERANAGTLTRQCQAVMLRMLKILDYICEKHDIKYFLIGGSLLGAIRHKGFIPWDDDLDIGMTRDNYEKFVAIGVQDLPNDIFFQTHQTDPGYPACEYVEARLRDKYSSYSNTDKNNFHQGLQVDIFVYDQAFLPHNYFIIAQNILLNKILGDNLKRARVLRFISRRFPFHLVYASSYLQRLGMWKFGSNYIMEEEIAELVRTKFEDMEAWIPAGWDSCLRRQYGDYMKLPPEDKQKGHHSVSETPDPFTPCLHKEVLQWKARVEYKINNLKGA